MLDFLKYILRVSSPKKPKVCESYSLQIFAKVNLLHIENDTEKEEIENYKQAEIRN